MCVESYILQNGMICVGVSTCKVFVSLILFVLQRSAKVLAKTWRSSTAGESNNNGIKK